MTDKQPENEAEHLLAFLNACEDDRHPWCVPLHAMDGAVPFSTSYASRKLAGSIGYMPNEGRPAVWPVDVKNVCLASESAADLQFPEGTLSFDRVRTCATVEARRMGFTRFSPTMVMREEVFALPSGEAQSMKIPFSLLHGRWVMAAPGRGPLQIGEFDLIEHMLGHALMLRYEWTVWLGYDDGPRIRFLSDPLGAREAFRLRDLPPGRERRAALRHWVSAHWRTRRDTAEDLAWVRQHLRGATDFTWNGLRCRIQPPEYDVERLAREAAERRAGGK